MNDTPIIDPDSIVVRDAVGTNAAGAEAFFYIVGDEVRVDTGLFDFLGTGEVATVDVFFASAAARSASGVGSASSASKLLLVRSSRQDQGQPRL